MSNKRILTEFIEISNKIHNNKYDYSKSIYKNSKTKLIITCPIHGDFSQKPELHTLTRSGCPSCDITIAFSNEKFIEKSILKHGNLYDYSNSIYINNTINIEIVCKTHGSFFQNPGAHLRGQGCSKCSNNQKSNTKEFIEKSIKIHGQKYDYSLVKYINKKEKVKILCLKHGVIEQKAHLHLSGHGCKICHNSKLELYLRNKLILSNINFISDYRFKECKNFLPLPFDFYLPTLNILIECDGIQHHKSINFFGGEKRFQYQKKNDLIKDNYCLEKNIILYRVNSFSDIEILLTKIQSLNNINK